MSCWVDPLEQLVIFDCDGVLVDSEIISNSLLDALLAEHGIAAGPQFIYDAFLGKSLPSISSNIRERFNIDVTPDRWAQFRGSFHGLGGEMERRHLTQAVLEGVCFALRDNLAALTGTGTQISAVTAVGGGANSRYWMQAVATILELPVHIPAEGDYGAAFGAARLALLAGEAGMASELCLPPEIRETIEPDVGLISIFGESYEKFKNHY